MKVMVIPTNWCFGNNRLRFVNVTGRNRNQRTSGDHLNYSIIRIGQNTEKSPGD